MDTVCLLYFVCFLPTFVDLCQRHIPSISDARDPDYWNVPDSPRTTNENWMGRLSDNQLVSDISVPGTHETMAREGGPAYWCQSLSLYAQMNLGLRFFDIRCRVYGSDLPIHHEAVYQGCTFGDVLDEVTGFLSRNPSEIIFMRVKQEYSSESHATFDERVRAYISRYSQEKFWLDNTIPTLTKARGKIVLLRNFNTNAPPFGIPYNSLVISDDYQATYSVKWDGVKRNLENAHNGPKTYIYLTFSSDSLIAPRDMARNLNTKLHDYVRGRTGRLGIIAMDYPGPGLVKDIIETNFYRNDIFSPEKEGTLER